MLLKYEKDVNVEHIETILEECEQLFDATTSADYDDLKQQGYAEIKFVRGLAKINRIRQLLKERETFSDKDKDWDAKK